MPVNKMLYDDINEKIIIATDMGVYYRNDGGNTWYRLGSDLPNLIVTDMELNRVTGDLYIGTFGRGIWKLHMEEYCYYNGEPTISGPTTVCSSGATFTLNNLPPEAIVNWTKSSNLSYVSGQGTDTYTVEAVNSITRGLGWVEAEILLGNCNPISVREKTWVGVKATITGNSYVSYLGSGSWYANSSSNQLTLNSVLSKSKKPTPLPGEETIFYLFVRASNGSGNYYQTSSKRIVAKGNVDLVVGHGGDLPPFELKISPNPANNIITVNIDRAEKTNPNIEYTVRLLDKYQKTIYQRNIKNSQTTINVSHFQTGIYYLQVINGQNMQSEKVIIID